MTAAWRRRLYEAEKEFTKREMRKILFGDDFPEDGGEAL
jgi:hypothetical protein